MTEREINGNRIISEFLGGEVYVAWKINNKNVYAWKGDVAEKWRKEVMCFTIGNSILCDHLEFHSNWKWLMPVVEKICAIDNEKDIDLAKLIEEANLEIFKTSILCHFDAVYDRVVQFAEFYKKI